MQSNKILIVGAGFSGVAIARFLAEKGFNCDVIDKRSHVAGNAYDYFNEHGIRIHQYGPHLFHTSNEAVFSWLSRFTEWVEYKHKVKALLSDGTYVTLPVNRQTKEIVGEENIIDIFIRPYTKKMWGMDIEQLDPSILQRVPIRDDLNEYYFPTDQYQYMPSNGYTELVNNILNHPNINLFLNTAFEKKLENSYIKVFNSMPIDEYYDFCYGRLPYRSIKFHTKSLPINSVLPVATVNFTNTSPYTRVTEWKKIPNHGSNDTYTTLTFEEPCDYQDNEYERYYPVKDLLGDNRDIYKKYSEIENKKNIFIGRCGLYAYLDMHQAISSALAIAEQYLKDDQ